MGTHRTYQTISTRLREVSAAVSRTFATPNGALVLALVLSLTAMVETLVWRNDGKVGPNLAVNLAATLPLTFAGRFPRVAATVITLAVLSGQADQPIALTISATLSLLIVLYLVATRYSRRWSMLFAAPLLLNAIAPFGGDAGRPTAFLVLVAAVAAQALGDSWRQRGEAIAERDATRDAMADTLREQTALEERTRIARELHDVVAHHLSMIAVQAETARHTTPGLSSLGEQRFEAIGATARDALTEMRRLLGVMRTRASRDANRAPQPGLSRLSELVDAARASGTYVRLTVDGPVVPLSPGVDLSAYRIIQEALTNARRHAPGAAVDVAVRNGPDVLWIRVADDGPGPTGPIDAGHGLLGMRERAAMVGGTLRAGPGDAGGFVIEADLPVGTGGGAPLPPPRPMDRVGG
ncbi:MAG TPA: sensor histidine kinase [Acidimicrobiales bacterium]|nr:sensor histidine kinase [Acidimicrobiales bacterium]